MVVTMSLPDHLLDLPYTGFWCGLHGMHTDGCGCYSRPLEVDFEELELRVFAEITDMENKGWILTDKKGKVVLL